MPYIHYNHILYSEHYIFRVYIITYLMFLYLCICICLLCTVVCMHNVHTAHIFIVCNSVMDQAIQYYFHIV